MKKAERAKARELGKPTYFTGKACINNHVSARSTSSGTCIECKNKWVLDNLEKRKNSCKKYSSKPESKAKAAEKAKKWRLQNPQYQKSYRAKIGAETLLQRQAVSRKKNPEVYRAIRQKRRAKEKNAEGAFSAQDIHNLFIKQQGFCVWCSKKIEGDYHIDHIRPLSKGGTNWPENLQLLHPKCNQSKGAKYEEGKENSLLQIGRYNKGI